jgi:hypothetical protein
VEQHPFVFRFVRKAHVGKCQAGSKLEELEHLVQTNHAVYARKHEQHQSHSRGISPLDVREYATLGLKHNSQMETEILRRFVKCPRERKDILQVLGKVLKVCADLDLEKDF